MRLQSIRGIYDAEGPLATVYLEARSPGDHLRAAFDGRRREGLVRHLRHFVRPTGWVERLWRE